MASILRDILDELAPSELDIKEGREERIKARNAIIGSAVALCPLTAFFVLLGLIVEYKITPMPSFLFTACLIYPLVGLCGVVLGMLVHQQKMYTTTLVAVVVLPVLNIGAILGGFIYWIVV